MIILNGKLYILKPFSLTIFIPDHDQARLLCPARAAAAGGVRRPQPLHRREERGGGRLVPTAVLGFPGLTTTQLATARHAGSDHGLQGAGVPAGVPAPHLHQHGDMRRLWR